MAPPCIIDSHIHLFERSHLPHFAWMTPASPLHAAHSVPEYTAASTADGYVFVETDRAYTSLEALEQPLDEIAFALSLRGSEGPRLLGMVPFAPIPLGREGMERWWALARGLGCEVEEMVKGVRYLVQDKLEGTMTNEVFVEGVQWALERGFAFDLGVDFRSGGRWQLREAQALLKRVFCEEKCVSWVVLNHLGKPDMTLPAEENQSFEPWRELVEGISKFPKVAVKLSGVFSEIDHAGSTDVESLAAVVLPWVRVAFECFGPERVMWGSDWPVCNIGYGKMVGREKQNGAWRCWRAVTEKVLETLVQDGTITEVQADDVWGAVAARIYGL